MDDIELRARPLNSIATIKQAVARRYKVRVADLEGHSRLPRYTRPRQLAMALCCRKLSRNGYSLNMIARHFGQRHHTTVLHAARKWRA